MDQDLITQSSVKTRTHWGSLGAQAFHPPPTVARPKSPKENLISSASPITVFPFPVTEPAFSPRAFSGRARDAGWDAGWDAGTQVYQMGGECNSAFGSIGHLPCGVSVTASQRAVRGARWRGAR